MNKIILTGNLGHDPSMKEISGKNVAGFSIGVSSGFGDKKSTTWYRIQAWDKKAEACKQYLVKGSKVLVIGELKAREYVPIAGKNAGIKQISLDVTVSDIEFLTTKSEAHAPTNQAQTASAPMDLDDLPF